MAGSPSDEFSTDFSSSLLQMSLSDNEQTWLYCLPGSDPNSVVDLSYFLCWDPGFKYDTARLPVECEKKSDRFKAAVSLSKAQRISEKRAKLKYPLKKNAGSTEDSFSHEGNFTLPDNLPVQSLQLNQNCSNLDVSRIKLDDSNLVAHLTIDESRKTNTSKSINNKEDSTLKNNSNSWNISERTLIFDVSAPKGFMDCTAVSYQTPSSDLSLFSKFNFNPNSVSTPTKKLVSADNDVILATSESINEPVANNNTFEGRANNTYNLSIANEKNNDPNETLNFNVTTTIPTSNTEIDRSTDVIKESEPKETLDNTYVFKDSSAQNLNSEDTKTLTNYNDVITTEDKINDALDKPLNLPYGSEADLNSTITIKSNDNEDSEEDSCYSSSSNIRSLGDVCVMSQMPPQKNRNTSCTLTKTRSEDSLCLPEHACSSRKPKKHYGSALSLETHNISQLTPDRRFNQNPNYFLRKPGDQVALPSVSFVKNNDRNVSMEKTLRPTRLSKIPRLQSKIPKLVLKK